MSELNEKGVEEQKTLSPEQTKEFDEKLDKLAEAYTRNGKSMMDIYYDVNKVLDDCASLAITEGVAGFHEGVMKGMDELIKNLEK